MQKRLERYVYWVIICLLSSPLSMAWGQDPLANETFISPVDHTIRMSGSFGELRPNHFHAGIDIKSKKGQEGDIVRAAASGFVSRIKIQRSGYGQVLYIDHPNGFTSVYAHLMSYAPKLEAYIEEKQYDAKSYEIDIFPEPNRFQFAQGEMIGLMGNTGRSYGPHLHFEIRHTKTEIPENPYLHGIGPTDSRAPLLYAVEAHGLDNEHHKIWGKRHTLSKKNSTVGPPTFFVPAWRAGLAIHTFDQMDNASNKNGIYKIEMRVDDSLHYSHVMDRVGFHLSKYINSHIDYKEKKNSKKTFTKCYVAPGNKLDFYPKVVNHGEIKLFKEKARKVDLSIQDFYGNETTYTCYLKRREAKMGEIKSPVFQKYLTQGKQAGFKLGSCRFFFPANSLDKNTYINYEESDEEAFTFRINEEDQPLFSYPAVSIPVKDIDPKYHAKVFLLKETGGSTYGGHIENDSLRVRIGGFGTYQVAIDTIPPTVDVGSFVKNAKGKPFFRFAINDNFEPSGYAKKLKYDVYIDGEWVIASLKAVGNIMIVPLDNVRPGEHTLKIRVEDDRKNVTVWERSFIN